MRPFATELTASYPRHLMVALGIAAGIHLALVCSYYGGAWLGGGTAGAPEIRIQLPVTLLPAPLDQEPKTVVRPGHVAPLPAARGVPVPVSDPVLDLEPRFGPDPATEPGPETEPGPGDVTAAQDVPAVTPGVLDSEEVQFVPCERLPEPVRTVMPEYPSIARAAGLEGHVDVQVLVSEDGHVVKARIARSSAALFERPALEAARQWLFTPALQQNRPVATWVQIPFRFSLRDAR